MRTRGDRELDAVFMHNKILLKECKRQILELPESLIMVLQALVRIYNAEYIIRNKVETSKLWLRDKGINTVVAGVSE